MLQSGPLAQALALDDAVALGADAVRAVVRWRDVAPRASSLTRPRAASTCCVAPRSFCT